MSDAADHAVSRRRAGAIAPTIMPTAASLIMTYTAEAGSQSETALKLLGSWAATPDHTSATFVR